MTDYFALLEEPRRPWLDADSLKSKFFALSAVVHPDRVHQLDAPARVAAGTRYAELNAAYQCLREPKSRLRHLLELERGAPPRDVHELFPDLADLILAVGLLCETPDRCDLFRASARLPKGHREWRGGVLLGFISCSPCV